MVNTPDFSLIARDVVFLDEMPIQLYGQHTPGYIAFEAHTALMTPEQCFEACQRAVSPLRFFNLYTNPATGKQVCSCVERFTGTRAQPGALVHGACLADDELGARLKTNRKHVLPGSRFLLRLKVASGKAVTAETGLEATVRVELPPEARYEGSYAIPPVRSQVSNSKVGPVLNGTKLVWDRVPLAPKRLREFVVRLRARFNTPPGTTLPFAAAVLLRPPVQGALPYCAKPPRTNETVIVVSKRGRWHL